MTSVYRDDLGAAEERLARLEASHLEREMRRLRELRDVTASQTPLVPLPRHATERRILMSGVVSGIVALVSWHHVLHGESGPHDDIPVRLLFVAAIFWAPQTVILAGASWAHRWTQAHALAKIDAAIAAIEKGRQSTNAAGLGDVRARIAELEAEEASAADDADGSSRRAG